MSMAFNLMVHTKVIQTCNLSESTSTIMKRMVGPLLGFFFLCFANVLFCFLCWLILLSVIVHSHYTLFYIHMHTTLVLCTNSCRLAPSINSANEVHQNVLKIMCSKLNEERLHLFSRSIVMNSIWDIGMEWTSSIR